MEFKVFMQAAEQQIDRFQSEKELKEWLKNYARTIEEEKREGFLKQFEKKKKQSHAEDKKAVIGWCEQIEDGELTLTCRGYEEYGESYWDSDWVYEYEDDCGIGRQIAVFYHLAEQCVYDRDYKTASLIFDKLGALTVIADDETGGDPVELEMEELVREGIVTLDLKRIATLTLYTGYQSTAMEQRPSKLYRYFAWDMFQGFKLEEMFAAGTEPLKDSDIFLELWIAYLREQKDRYTSRLLTEAVLYRYGQDGLLEEARRNANRHPGLYVEILEQYYTSGAWDALYQEGRDALDRMERNMKIRERVARLTAAGARALKNTEGIREACKEAFYSAPSSANYLRMIACEGLTEADKNEALQYVEKCWQACEKRRAERKERCYWRETSDTDPSEIRRHDYLTIQFFARNFDLTLRECREQNAALGWSGEYVAEGVPLLLLFLFKDTAYSPAMKVILRAIRSNMGYGEEYNEPAFEEIMQIWRRQEKSTPDIDMEKKVLEYLQNVIDDRVNAIVSGCHRGSYGKAALLGAALGEVEESMGIPQGKRRRMEKYLLAFPKHRAFKSEMREYGGA